MPLVKKIELYNEGKLVTSKTILVDIKDLYLNPTLILENACTPIGSNIEVTWSTSDSKYLIISNGILTFKKIPTSAKTFTVKATAKDGSKKYSTVKISALVKGEELLIKGNDSAALKKTTKLSTLINGTNKDGIKVKTTNQKVSWVSSDTSVLSIKYGIITGKKLGKAIVTAISKENGSIISSKEITVKPLVTKVNAILDEEIVNGKTIKLSLKEIVKGNAFNISSSVLPIDAIEDVSYKSSNTKVISITSDGTLTIKSVPKKATSVTATVTAKDGNKKYALFKISLKKILAFYIFFKKV